MGPHLRAFFLDNLACRPRLELNLRPKFPLGLLRSFRKQAGRGKHT